MAKYFQLITVDTPTGLTATPQAGGSLPIGTTYYYRVIAVRAYQPAGTSDIYLPIYSIPTTEVSATTDSDNRTIRLSWNAVTNAYGYYVQRTTVSGNYPVGGQNSLKVSSQLALLLNTTLTDDGTLSFTFENLDFTEPSPLTEVYSNNNDTIEQYEILAYALSAGWSHIRCPFPQGIVGSNLSSIRMSLPLFFNGGLYLHDCKFYWRGPIGCINGGFYSGNVEYLSSVYSYSDIPTLYFYNYTYPRTTSDGKNGLTTHYFRSQINGAGRLGLLCQFNLGRGMPYSTVVSMNEVGGNISVDLGIIYHGTGDYVTHNSQNLNRVYTMGIEPAHNVSNFNTVKHKTYGNSIHHDVVYVSDFTWHQLGWGTNDLLVNPTFCVSPYKVAAYIPDINYVAITIGYVVDIIVTDSDGGPIDMAKVSITDQRGLPDSFVLTDAYCTVNINDTDIYTTLTVTNAYSLQVGDVVRIMGSDEHMIVTNIVGSSVTFQRGYNGTTKRKYYGYRNPKFEKFVEVFTDNNGKASVILYSWLLVNKKTTSYLGNYLENLISSGYYDRYYMTPHRLKVEAPGYATYECEVEVTEPLSLVVALSPPGGGGTMTITEHAHAIC